jgi:non-specific serine/threonine protein kinase/serine/threonine-protein kinase
MNPERWQRVKQLVDEAVAVDGSKWPSFLDDACDGDTELRREVESLLSSHKQAGTGFLNSPAIHLSSEAPGSVSRVGRRIGVYEIVEEIGRGGMGEIYRAVRADGQYNKEVALKVVRGGFDTTFALERFRNERQILATLDHPNIARLMDGGTTEDGIPYLVMELIEGTRIDLFCDEHSLSITQRLQLFRQVCEAVQYAHQRLVIHRDIKPSNILVTRDGVPKLLDFGIAKILDPSAGAETTLAPALTPEYASPEQVRGEAITTASDVYSLGVVLYQLLTGRSPYPRPTYTAHELARAVCESEAGKPSSEVLKPRTAVDGRDIETSPERVSSTREGSPAKLQRRLAGDLDAIVLMALRKEPARRYTSVEQFARDISRHLERLPVTAAPDSLLYRGNKFIRRHRVGMAAAVVILLTATVGVVATLQQARIATANELRADRRFTDVRKLANSMLFEIHDSIQDLPGSIPARKLLVERALQYLDSLAQESGSDPSLQRELAIAYKRVGDVQGYPFRANLGDTEGALKSYRKALAIEEILVKANPDSTTDALDLAAVDRRLSELDSMHQDMVSALAEGQRAVEIGERMAERLPQDKKVQQDLARDYQTLAGIEGGNLSANLGDALGALKLHRKVTEIAERLSTAEPADPSLRRFLASAVLRLGDQLVLTGTLHEAQNQYVRGKEILEALASPNNATSQMDLAGVYADLGSVQLAIGDVVAAEASCRKAVELYKALSQADPRDANVRTGLAAAYMNFGDTESRSGRTQESSVALQSAQTIADQLVSTSPTAEVRNLQGQVLATRGEAAARAGGIDTALRYYREALSVYAKLNADDPRNVDSRLCLAATHDRIGEIFVRKGDAAQALDAFQTALKLARTAANTDNSNAQMFYTVADAYTGLGDATRLRASDQTQPRATRIELWRSAQSYYQESLQVWHKVPEPGFVSPDGFDCVPPSIVTRRLERCQRVLKKLDTGIAKAS